MARLVLYPPVEARPEIAQLRPYQPGKPASELRRELGLERIVKLASNEGPLGPFPAALEALADAAATLNRYPELGRELAERLADRHGLGPERVAPGNGADAVIGHLSLAYLRPGDEVVMGWPSFVSYHLSAVKMGAQPVHVALRDGACDLEAMAARIGPATRMVYVCSPNNPTGGIVSGQSLARFLDGMPEGMLVVIDAAYHEYVDDPRHADAISEYAHRPNVVVLRTFSKIYGLAGLRIGYAVAAAEVVEQLAKVRGPFDVSQAAAAAAIASLGDAGELARRRDQNRAERERLVAGIRSLGLDPLPAAANFVCVEVGDGDALAGRLEREGVIVRPLAAFGAAGCIRVTVGLNDENDLFLSALERCMQPA
jgi:histidinol-phosphate aminotransferase